MSSRADAAARRAQSGPTMRWMIFGALTAFAIAAGTMLYFLAL